MAEGLVKESESKVVAVTTLEQIPYLMVGVHSPPTSEDDVEMVDNLLTTELIL